jgi:hypothetical protein
MPACAQSHPEKPSLLCDQQEGNHRLCTGYDAAGDTFLDWDNPGYAPPKSRSRKGAQAHMEAVAARVAPDIRVQSASTSADASAPAPAGFAKGLQESERASRRWDDREKQLVMDAIIAVAKREDEFTSDAIWAELAARVPVTKGLTAMLMLADRRGIVMSTGKTEKSARGGEHDHGQRLTIWCSLIKGQR